MADSELVTRGNINRGLLKKYWVQISLAIIILTSFFLMIFSARSDSLVVDEKVHISAGYLHVWKGNFTFNPEHPPLLNNLAGLFAKLAKPNLPTQPLSTFKSSDQWEFGDLFFFQSSNDMEKITFYARIPFIFLTLGLIYLCFIWAKTLYGPKGGLIAAVLAAFSPNILAHGRLATTDMGLVFFFVLTIWFLRKYLLGPNWQRAVYLALAISGTILAKFSGLIILPIVVCGLIVGMIGKKRSVPQNTLFEILIILVVPLILFWAVYIFSMRSEIGPGWNWLILPWEKFKYGYSILAEHNAVGHWNYLNGQINTAGWWYYFPLVLWYKLTIPTLILFSLAVILSFTKKLALKSFLEEFLIIFAPILFLIASAFSKIDIGIRHILVILPFLYIFVARLALIKVSALKIIITLLVLTQIIIGILAFPNYIAYFNQIAGGPQNGINHLIDSNLDWNQNMIRFAEYARTNNIKEVYEYCWDYQSFEYYGIKANWLPTEPIEGIVVVCGQQLKMAKAYEHDVTWVEKYPPDAIIGNTMYVWRYDLKPIE